MSEANVNAVYEHAMTALTSEEQLVLIQRIASRNAELSGQNGAENAESLDAERIRRQRAAIAETHGIFEGSTDASSRHDEIIYGRAKR